MKTRQSVACIVLCVILALTLGVGAFASGLHSAQQPQERAGGYTYTVRIYAGSQGIIGGGTVIEYTGLSYGDRVSFSASEVTLINDNKYYVRGIRESGMDNSTVGTNSFTVTRDQDYVVAYGVLKDSVSYTINFVDADGNALADSETYYGNVGDKPVVAFKFIDGYQPQAYNLTGTLSENAASNQFTFIYTLIPVAETGETTEGEAATEGETEGETAEGAAAGEAAGEQAESEQAETLAEPEEILDMDVPLADFGDIGGNDGTEGAGGLSGAGAAEGVIGRSGLSTGAIIGISVGAAAVIAVGLWLGLRKKKAEAKADT